MKHSKGVMGAVLVLSIGMLTAATGARAAIAISADPTQNMSCSAGICTPTATDAVLNCDDLTTMLSAGFVSVATTGSGVEADDIRVTAPVVWTASSLLVLNAHRSIVVASTVQVEGNGSVALTAGAGSAPVPLFFVDGGSLSFNNLPGGLIINGTPYKLVDTVKKLARAIAARPSRAYALAHDIDARREGVYSSSPIAMPFSGKFSGLGHVVSELRIVDAASVNVGFFSTVLSKGSVSNVGIAKTSVFGGQTVGGLVGFNQGSVSNSFMTGTVRGIPTPETFLLLGGLVGENAGTVTNCWTDANVFKGYAAGGLVGENEGVVDSSFANGSVVGFAAAGGLVGWNSGNPVTITGSITNSYATGSAKLQTGENPRAVGGLLGWNPGFQTSLSTVSTSYSTGAVSGVHVSNIGGSTGWQEGTATNVYWDTTTSGTAQGVGLGDGSGVTGLTSTELQSGLPAGFDPSLWDQDPAINNGYPYLLANPPE